MAKQEQEKLGVNSEDERLLNEFSQLVMKLGKDVSKEHLFPFVETEFEKLRTQVEGLLDHVKCGELGEVPGVVQKPITKKLDDIKQSAINIAEQLKNVESFLKEWKLYHNNTNDELFQKMNDLQGNIQRSSEATNAQIVLTQKAIQDKVSEGFAAEKNMLVSCFNKLNTQLAEHQKRVTRIIWLINFLIVMILIFVIDWGKPPVFLNWFHVNLK